MYPEQTFLGMPPSQQGWRHIPNPHFFFRTDIPGDATARNLLDRLFEEHGPEIAAEIREMLSE